MAPQTEQARRLPDELLELLIDAGLFRMLMPKALGGSEHDPPTVLQVIEELSAADASVGWTTTIGATTNMFAAYLPEAAAQAIFGADPKIVSGGNLHPIGRAVPAPGGYRVSGRWPYASGCQHCAWLVGNCLVYEDGEPRLTLEGETLERTVFFPASAVRIHDTWHVSGLCGTGSHDIEVNDIFVPEERSFEVFVDPPRQSGKLYKLPVLGFLAIQLAAIALGIARGAKAALVELTTEKVRASGKNLLPEQPVAMIQLAEAEMMLQSARTYVYEVMKEVWTAAPAAPALAGMHDARLRLATIHAVESSARVVDLLYRLGGSAALYDRSPLQRAFRDIHAVTQHAIISRRHLEPLGRILFEAGWNA